MKILIIGPSWIGDTVMSQVLYRLLIQRYYKVYIDVITTSYCYPLIKRMPGVQDIFITPYNHGILSLRKIYKLAKILKNKKYQKAFILPNSFKSALIPFFASIPHRIGWRGEIRYGLLNDIRILNKNIFPLMIHRYAALAYDKKNIHHALNVPKYLLWPNLSIEINELQNTLKVFNINNIHKLIGLCPGAAFGLIKRWPHYHYATLIKNLIIRGYQVIILGSIQDLQIGTLIQQMIPLNLSSQYYNLIGQTSIDQVISLIAACTGIVSNDSGLMHIANALRRPVIALYGPSSPNITPPLSDRAVIINTNNNFYDMKKKFSKIKKYHVDLIALHPDKVLTSLEKLIKLNNK